MAYYGVYIPIEKRNSASEDDSPKIFENRVDAFQMLKKYREARARLKQFKTHEEAKYFTIYGCESSETSSMGNGTTANNSDWSSSNNADGQAENGVPGAHSPVVKSPMVGEKASNFRGPTSQELVKFRKCIEQGKFGDVSNQVWENPRYLISSGDTPTILKESFRYNALHVAALAKNAKMCALLLEIVSDVKFIQLFYGKDNNARNAEEVAPILLDLYLNMPEKGRNETPLHLAVKFGADEVVEVLTSYKECLMTVNCDGLLPKDMICSRLDGVSGDLVNRIRSMLQERFYVPVIRSVDNSMPPIIGEPFSPTQSIMSIVDPLSPEMEIKAVAGPMNKDQAETFRKRWKTPPRGSPRESPLNISVSPLSSHHRVTPINGNEPIDKWTDKTPRRLFDGDLTASAKSDLHVQEFSMPKNGVGPTADLSVKKNLFFNYRDRLNDSLNDSMGSLNNTSMNDNVMGTPGYAERNVKLADVDKGLEVVGRCLAKAQNVGWKEFWNFLGELVDIASIEGLDKFENYLQQRSDEKKQPPQSLPLFNNNNNNNSQRPGIDTTPLSIICSKISKFHLSRDLNCTENSSKTNNGMSQSTPLSSPNAFHAYLCVEKSCQVFAKRLLKPISQQPTNVVAVNDAFSGELGRLKSLVCSYKEDLRFFAIDFRAAHARFAHILVALLKELETTESHDCIENLEMCLRQILLAKEKSLASHANNNNGTGESVSSTQQLICLIRFILKRIAAKDDVISPETLTTERDCSDVWSTEEKCDCEWINQSSNGKVNRSIKRRLDLNQKMNELSLNASVSAAASDQEEDESYWSLNNSDEDDSDDEFFTPPSTPSHSFFENSILGLGINFNNYIFGEEPTKVDHDVFKALHDVEIDDKTYPNIHQWYAAMLNYTLEERESFPPFQWKRCNAEPLSAKPKTIMNRVFQSISPVKEMPSRYAPVHLKPSVLSKNF